MIPKKAIKKVKNEVHLDIAAGSLLAYGVFPQTSEGIQKAKETAASKDTWLAPSDLPEYYDGIDSDLIMGKENDAIRAIRRQLKDFYGISSAGTEGYIDTRSSRPATPAGIEIQWYLINQVGPNVWKKLKAQLTGKGYFSEVNLSEKDADELIANIKKSGEFPSLKDQSGIHNEVYQNWLVDTYLPNYGKTQVYNPGDKFVDDGKEFADKIIDDLDVALEETSNEIEDAIDAILEADKKKYEDFKKQLNRKVNHPKLYKELQHIKPRYMWGQNGLYDLEFKSDIDKAIYFAGKLGGDKDSPVKKAVREWIFAVTGLNIYDDYEEIKEYRERIKVFILKLIKLHPDETEVIVPPIYDGAFDEPDQEEEYEEDEEEMDNEEEADEEEIDEEEYDDLYGNSLDDLLEDVRDENEEEDPEEVADQIEEKKQELVDAVEETPAEDDEEEDEGDIGSEDEIPDELLQDDIDPSALEEILNKRKGKTGTKERKSYYVSNTKLLQGITNSLSAVSGQLEQVNQSLLEQNQLIKTNIDLNIATLETLRAQDDIISAKFDAILNAFQQQYGATKKAQDDLENLRAEQQLEQKTVAAGSENPEDLTKGKKGKGGIGGNIAKWLARRVGKFLFNRFWKLLPKGLRSRIRLARMAIGGLKRKLPSKIASNIAPRIAQKISGNAGLRAAKAGIVSSGGRVLSSIKGGITDIGSKALTKGKGTIKTGINTITETVKSPAAKEAVTKMLGPVNKAAINQLTEPKSGLKIALAAFNNEKIRNAISIKAGKEVLEKAMAKLGFKVAGQFTGVGTVLNVAYGIGEAITRTAMGDPKGGLLSLGGALPFVGAGFSIVDILRDIDVAAYTKHIEPNLTSIASGDGKPVAAFFNEIAGTEMQYEKGTPEAKPGTAILHGTELLIDKNKARNNTSAPSINSPLNSVGATLVSAASKFITGLGPAGAKVAPMFKQMAAPLLKIFGAPSTTAQTNVGGAFSSSIGSTFKKAKDKKQRETADEYEGMSREEIEMIKGNPESFAEKLLKMIDPENKFKNFLDNLTRKITNPFTPLETYDGTGIEGDLKGNIVNPMEQGELQDYPGAKFGAPRDGGSRPHLGRDIIGPPGMKFVSALPGKVTEVFTLTKLRSGKGTSYGITVEHANNIKTRYLHVSPSVKIGDQVKAGQKLGVITDTDLYSSAPHLHFEMIVNGKHVDPDKAGNSILRKAYKMADIQAGKVPGLALNPDGSTPLESYAGTPAGPTGGQDIKENFGMQTGQERMFTSGGKQFKAHKTATGFEFFDGMTRLNTTKDAKGNVANQSIVNDFVAQQKQSMYAPPKPQSIEMINQFETDEQSQYIVINQQKQPQLPQGYGNIQFQNTGGQWRSTKEIDVKVIEKLRLSLQ